MLRMRRALSLIRAPRINGRLYKVVAIFTPAPEGDCMARLSIGSYFTVTLGSDDDRSSFLAAETDLPALPRDLVCDHVLPLASQILPQHVWLYLILSLPKECIQAHAALGVPGACPCGFPLCC